MLNLVEQCLRGVCEQHVGLVEEEYKFRQWQIAHLGQGGVEFREQPQQERRVEFWLHHQFIGGQHVHDTLAAFCLHQVVDIE